ncbi:Uncharacterised protein [Klebsiella pneumoniae]|uniref:Uncharacterized protein n=1 Tax=Klebsiella pneumoniae TaxID=573 RepID=A0A377V1A7_KLEPN|nr:Uncharacterised protein [Klebsiella pneumoniae]
MTNYFDSPFKGKLLSEQVKNPQYQSWGGTAITLATIMGTHSMTAHGICFRTVMTLIS